MRHSKTKVLVHILLMGAVLILLVWVQIYLCILRKWWLYIFKDLNNLYPYIYIIHIQNLGQAWESVNVLETKKTVRELSGQGYEVILVWIASHWGNSNGFIWFQWYRVLRLPRRQIVFLIGWQVSHLWLYVTPFWIWKIYIRILSIPVEIMKDEGFTLKSITDIDLEKINKIC